MRLLCVTRCSREATRKSFCPGCGCFALAGAEERLPGCKVAPALAGLRQPGRDGERIGVRSGSGPPVEWSLGLCPPAAAEIRPSGLPGVRLPLPAALGWDLPLDDRTDASLL